MFGGSLPQQNPFSIGAPNAGALPGDLSKVAIQQMLYQTAVGGNPMLAILAQSKGIQPALGNLGQWALGRAGLTSALGGFAPVVGAGLVAGALGALQRWFRRRPVGDSTKVLESAVGNPGIPQMLQQQRDAQIRLLLDAARAPKGSNKASQAAFTQAVMPQVLNQALEWSRQNAMVQQDWLKTLLQQRLAERELALNQQRLDVESRRIAQQTRMQMLATLLSLPQLGSSR